MTKLPLIKIKHMLLKSTIKIFLMGRNHWFLSSTVTILFQQRLYIFHSSTNIDVVLQVIASTFMRYSKRNQGL